MGGRMNGLLLLACLIAGATVAHAGEKLTTRSYPIPTHGSLELTMPESWKDKVGRPPQNLPPTIGLMPSEGDDFKILVTAGWNVNGVSSYSNGLDSLRPHMDAMKQRVESSSEEKEIELQLLDGSTGKGYYFQATDKAPKPGEFKYMIQAMVGVGDLLLAVTVLYRDRDSEAVPAALTMLGNAAHIPPSLPSADEQVVDIDMASLVQMIETASILEGTESDSLTRLIYDRVKADTSGVAVALLPRIDLYGKSEKAVALCIWALGLAKVTESVDTICKIMGNAEDGILLSSCREALGKIGGEKSGKCLISELDRTSDQDKRFVIFNILGEMQYTGALPLALEVLQNDREGQYWRPIFVFGKMGDIAIPYLIEKIGDDDDNVRWNAMNVLGHWLMAPEASGPMRAQFWREKDPIMRNLVLSSLEMITTDLDTLTTFMKKVVAEAKDTASVRFAKESIEMARDLLDSARSVAARRMPSPEMFDAAYSRLWEEYGHGDEEDYAQLGTCSAVENEPALKRLRERIFQRDSDEALLDIEKVNNFIIWNRLISSSANRNR